MPWVHADPGSLTRVLTLLIENAIAYRGARPLKIRVSAEAVGQDVVLKVADNGDGFDPGRREDIFDAFKRLHSQSEVPGAGLGLSIAKRIVEHHGGRMRAESVRGSGATFFIQLPRARSVLQREADQERARGLQAMLAFVRTPEDGQPADDSSPAKPLEASKLGLLLLGTPKR
jgi:signal transduction histidine kinase